MAGWPICRLSITSPDHPNTNSPAASNNPGREPLAPLPPGEEAEPALRLSRWAAEAAHSYRPGKAQALASSWKEAELFPVALGKEFVVRAVAAAGKRSVRGKQVPDPTLDATCSNSDGTGEQGGRC